jgi:hypothetical protein
MSARVIWKIPCLFINTNFVYNCHHISFLHSNLTVKRCVLLQKRLIPTICLINLLQHHNLLTFNLVTWFFIMSLAPTGPMNINVLMRQIQFIGLSYGNNRNLINIKLFHQTSWWRQQINYYTVFLLFVITL